MNITDFIDRILINSIYIFIFLSQCCILLLTLFNTYFVSYHAHPKEPVRMVTVFGDYASGFFGIKTLGVINYYFWLLMFLIGGASFYFNQSMKNSYFLTLGLQTAITLTAVYRFIFLHVNKKTTTTDINGMFFVIAMLVIIYAQSFQIKINAFTISYILANIGVIYFSFETKLLENSETEGNPYLNGIPFLSGFDRFSMNHKSQENNPNRDRKQEGLIQIVLGGYLFSLILSTISATFTIEEIPSFYKSLLLIYVVAFILISSGFGYINDCTNNVNKYTINNLMHNESVLLTANTSGIVFFPCCVLLLLCIYYYAINSIIIVNMLITVFILFFILALKINITNELSITTEIIIAKHGLISNSIACAYGDYHDIINIRTATQGFSGYMFNYGTIVISEGKNEIHIKYINNPDDFRNKAQNIIIRRRQLDKMNS